MRHRGGHRNGFLCKLRDGNAGGILSKLRSAGRRTRDQGRVPNAAPPPPPGLHPPIGSPSAPGLSQNVASALCYVFGLVTGIIFLVLAPYNQDKTIRFHAFQSIFMHVGIIILFIALGIISVDDAWIGHLRARPTLSPAVVG